MRVLVVCHANINRSPLCAALLAQTEGVEVLQAALKDWKRPERAAKKIRVAGEALGVDLEDHRSQPITQKLLYSSNVVIYMDGGNLKRLLVFAGVNVAPLHWHCLGEFADLPVRRIPDPGFQAKGSQEFADTVHLIAQATLNLAKVIAPSGK